MLRFKFVKRKDLSENAAEDATMFYPQLVSNGRVSFEDLCDQVAEESALTSADVKACVDRLVKCLSTNLKEGRSVDCGDLGSFRINIRSKGVKNVEEYDPETMMRAPGVQYYPGKKLREMRKVDVRFERVTTPTEEPEDDEQQGIPNP